MREGNGSGEGENQKRTLNYKNTSVCVVKASHPIQLLSQLRNGRACPWHILQGPVVRMTLRALGEAFEATLHLQAPAGRTGRGN